MHKLVQKTVFTFTVLLFRKTCYLNTFLKLQMLWTLVADFCSVCVYPCTN